MAARGPRSVAPRGLTARAAPGYPRGVDALPLPFPSPWLLAPMEGVTDPLFRSLVLARHTPAELGGAFTEFVRVVDEPLPRFVLERHLGSGGGPADREQVPVGLQLMGSDLSALAGTAERVVGTRAALLDLNFGCPARGALRGCAGSALLREPREVERVVRTCVEAVGGRLPVSAKIRAGYDDDRLLEDLAGAAEAGGASLLTVHCRTRAEGYCEEVDWSRIARAVGAVSIPVCGNGGVEVHADLERMRRETGCALVMVGRAALGDPWVFSGRRVDRAEALGFLVEYHDRMVAEGAPVHGAVGRVKQLLRTWRAGGWPEDEGQRRRWLRCREAGALRAELGAGLARAAV